MREILFRGKRKANGEWVEGYLYINRFGDYEILKYCKELNLEFVTCEVIPETVGQFTGLSDKNGTRIFEGDIVTGYFNYEKIIGYIFYGGNAHFFIQRDGILGIGLDNADCWLEVIGNIHDNPEMLNAAAKDIAFDADADGLAPATENFELMRG